MNDYLGQLPIRQDITVLPGDEPKKIKIGWAIKEYNGFEIHKLTEEMKSFLTPHQIYDDRQWLCDGDDKPIYHKPITVREDLKVGDEVVLKDSPFDYIWGNGIVEENDKGELRIRISENCVAFIEFDQDDRHCWSTTCVCNLKALGKVEFNMKSIKEKDL